LELLQDIPDAEISPPDNVLFVCKLHPVTTEEDLDLIFSRFGKIKSCDIIRDHVTNDSLCYGFIEYESAESAEEAYFKMNKVLIDDRRIHVDFSQSVAKVDWSKAGGWRNYFKTRARDLNKGGGGKSNIGIKRIRDRDNNFKLKDTYQSHNSGGFSMLFGDDSTPRVKKQKTNVNENRDRNNDKERKKDRRDNDRRDRDTDRRDKDRDRERRDTEKKVRDTDRRDTDRKDRDTDRKDKDRKDIDSDRKDKDRKDIDSDRKDKDRDTDRRDKDRDTDRRDKDKEREKDRDRERNRERDRDSDKRR